VKAFVAVTDEDWFRFLSSLAEVDEVNFWQPSGGRVLRALQSGEPLLFKLHAPFNAIAGGGFFIGHSIIPASMAWDSFREKNGAASFEGMLQRIERYVHRQVEPDHQVGCILLGEPFFWTEDRWIAQPADWKPNIVTGKTYDLAEPPIGTKLWEEVQFRLLTEELTLQRNSLSTNPTKPKTRCSARSDQSDHVWDRAASGSW
jgi:putative restriction endonuclease